MGFKCIYGACKNDSRYSNRPHMKGVRFIAVPNQRNCKEQRKRWLDACGRVDFNDSVKPVCTSRRPAHICSLHFVDGRPTRKHPDPIQYDMMVTKIGNRRKILGPSNIADSVTAIDKDLWQPKTTCTSSEAMKLPNSQDEMTFEVDNDYNPKSCLTVNVPHHQVSIEVKTSNGRRRCVSPESLKNHTALLLKSSEVLSVKPEYILPHSQHEMTFEVDHDYNPKTDLIVNVPHHQAPKESEEKDSNVTASLLTSRPTAQQATNFASDFLLIPPIFEQGDSDTVSTTSLSANNYTLEDIRRLLPYPHNLVTCYTRNAVIFGKLNDSEDAFVFKVTINNTMETELKVLGRTLDVNHPLVPLFPETIDNETTLQETLKLFETWKVCKGNDDEVFRSLYHKLLNKTAFLSFHTGSLHSSTCSLLTNRRQMRCIRCMLLRSALRCLRKRNGPSSFNKNVSITNRKQLINKMKCAQAIKKRVFAGKILSKVENRDTKMISLEVKNVAEVKSDADRNMSFEYSGIIEWTVS